MIGVARADSSTKVIMKKRSASLPTEGTSRSRFSTLRGVGRGGIDEAPVGRGDVLELEERSRPAEAVADLGPRAGERLGQRAVGRRGVDPEPRVGEDPEHGGGAADVFVGEAVG